MVAGLLVGVLGVAVTISFATLVFRGDMAEHLGDGMGWALAGLVIVGLIAALTSSFPGAFAGPQDATAVVVSSAAAGIAASASNPLPTLVAFILVSSVVTGTLLILLGRFRLGGLVRYVPYPVVAGFLGGTGLILFMAGVGQLATPGAVSTKLLPGLLLGLLIAMLARSGRSPSLIAAVLAVGFAGYHAIAAITGVTGTEGVSRGLLLGPFARGSLANLGVVSEVTAADWSAVLAQAPAIVAMALIVPLALLLNIGGLEQTFKTDIHIDRELSSAGLGMIATGPFAAVPGYVYFSATVVARRIGGVSRIPPLIAAGFAATVLVLGPGLISLVPVMVPAALLIGFGLDLILSWMWEVRNRVTTLEHLVIFGIVATIGTVGLVQGVGLGLVAATILFVVRYARTSPIRRLSTVSDRRSSVQRNASEERVLTESGDRVVLVELHGYLFFGTAEQVVKSTRQALESTQGVEVVVMDLGRVSGMDSSVTASFDRLGRLAETMDFRVVVCGPDRLTRPLLDLSNDRFECRDDLDRALESVEEFLLTRAGPTTHTGLEWSDVPAVSLQPGAAIITEGAVGAGVFFLEQGRACVGGPGGRRAVLLPGSVIGELSHLTGDPAMATVVCDTACLVRHMSPEWLKDLAVNDPARALEVERLIGQRLAVKLNAANRTIRSLL